MPGQADVQQDHLGPELPGHRQRLGSVVGDPHLLAVEPRQQPRQAPGGVHVVVHDQDAATGRLAVRPPATAPGRCVPTRPARRGRAAGPRTRCPVPGPSLCAAIEPPCISTSVRTRLRPIPRPPWAWSRWSPTWTNMSKTFGSISGLIPIPVSRTRMTTSPPSGSTDSRIRPPGSVYLAALFSRFQRICSSLVGSASSRIAPVGQGDGQLVAALVDLGPGRLDRLPDDRGQVHDLPVQLDLAPVDPGDVHQVVDQPRQVDDVAARPSPARPPSAVAVRPPHQVQRVADRGQGVAQLVGQGGEELVLAAVRLLQLAVEPGVLDGDRRARGQVLGQPQVVRPVAPARLGRDERDRPERGRRAPAAARTCRTSAPARAGCGGGPRPGARPRASRR